MSSTTEPTDDAGPPTPRSTGDPWPHEHGEHPGGLSRPEGYGRPAEHEHHPELLGAPQVVDEARRRRIRAIGWLAVLAVIAVAAIAVLVAPPW